MEEQNKSSKNSYLHWGSNMGPLVQICSLEALPPPPLVLTSSGGHQHMYGWQPGGTHPTGIIGGSKGVH